ncbi:hypothetical protein PHYSODRAFT_523109 [Phytophthora sojae]|uniref:Kazal-like domain-containing protein n=2 Tax=Phytophthora sojae TaxID=67593 RepID=G5A319_PHYSP|nr:hypothetical protein PHYSODRAFT_522348 [Phytophthora sojae]XP_009534921.1 hypothetical protein PHYSODRAFT_523109 [Phytophthora sojae]AAO24652.1 unknown protein [Phytophthora sojae]EGZ10059.1 hypothetical protein PHYSODRAFT_522348 [Phytophthora sojae]EGZ10060.1 hypothetical protein PHYSODRAFT_523109 [Phytophthora sojae]|eukprot:XP_009534920.1 hypothetical protein PHYSODRAFT_522348 [Phytophthora sojae]
MKFAAVFVLASLVIVGISADDSSSACDRLPCPENAPLICASNGVTYENRCVFDHENCNSGNKWTVLHEGTCSRSEGGR